MLLPHCYYHRGTRLNTMKRFCICSLLSHLNVLTFSPLTGGCSEGLLPIHSGHQVRWTYQPGSHRRKVTQDFASTFLLRCVPSIIFSREKDSAIPFPRRPGSRILCPNDLIVFHSSAFKNPVCRDRTHVPMCQKVTRLHLSYRGDLVYMFNLYSIAGTVVIKNKQASDWERVRCAAAVHKLRLILPFSRTILL